MGRMGIVGTIKDQLSPVNMKPLKAAGPEHITEPSIEGVGRGLKSSRADQGKSHRGIPALMRSS